MKRLLQTAMMIIITVSSFAQVTISMENKGGVFYIPGKVNGLSLQFIFDTGASNVYISLTEALFMLKNGYITEKEFGNTSYAQVADGSIVENTEVTLREIEVGGIKLCNVKASVSNTLNAPLLFGQSAIQKLGPIQIDGNKLIISNGSTLPSNETAFSLYQKAYQESETGNYENAITLSKQALAMATDKKLRAILYDNIAFAYYHSNRKDEAIAACNSAIGEDLWYEQPAYNIGVYYFEMGELTKALRAFNVFIERHKNTKNKNILSDAFAYKGDCHSKNGELVDAENAYKQSLSLRPNFQSKLGLAELYFNLGKYNEAIPLYKATLEYEQNSISNIKMHYQLGYCYSNLNMQSESINEFRNCLNVLAANRDIIEMALKSEDESIKNTAIFNLYLGCTSNLWIARLTDEPSEKIANYEKIIEFPGIANKLTCHDFLSWASAYTANGETPRSIAKALTILKNGLIVLQDNPDILFSCALYTDPNSSECLDYLMRILDQEYTYKPIFFDYGTVYNNIAWHYMLNKNYTEALSYAQTAIKMNPEHIYSWDTLGEIYYNLELYEDAINAFGQCLKSENIAQVKKAYKFRGDCFLHLGKKKDAEHEFNLSK